MLKTFQNHQSLQIPNYIFQMKKEGPASWGGWQSFMDDKAINPFKTRFHTQNPPKYIWSFFCPTLLLVLSKWCFVALWAYTSPSSCPYLRNSRPRSTQGSAEHKIILLCLQTHNCTALELTHGQATCILVTPKNIEANNSHHPGFPSNTFPHLKILRYVLYSACHWNKQHFTILLKKIFSCLVYFETLCNQTAQLFA